jgi:ATP-dependent Clp protease protease subunit
MPTPDWLQEKLFDRRMVFVTGRLDAALAAQTAAQIMALDASGDEPIDVFLDSGAGTLEAAFVLIDAVDSAQATVRGHCRGQVGGAAIGVAVAADHRIASPHTTFRLTAPAAEFSGTPDQIAAQTEQHRRVLWAFQARLAKATGRPLEDIADDMSRGRFLDAREALEYRLIDAIGA